MFYFVVMKIIKLTSILVLALISLQCINAKKNNSAQQDSIMSKKGFKKASIVDKTGLDGCSFLIQTSDSIMFEPIKMEEKYKKDGLEVYIKFKRFLLSFKTLEKFIHFIGDYLVRNNAKIYKSLEDCLSNTKVL